MRDRELRLYKRLLSDGVFINLVCLKIGKLVSERLKSGKVRDIKRCTISMLRLYIYKHYEKVDRRVRVDTNINWHHMFILLSPTLFGIEYYE